MSYGIQINTTAGLQDATLLRSCRLVAMRYIRLGASTVVVPNFTLSKGFYAPTRGLFQTPIWNESTKTYSMPSTYQYESGPDITRLATPHWVLFMEYA